MNVVQTNAPGRQKRTSLADRDAEFWDRVETAAAVAVATIAIATGFALSLWMLIAGNAPGGRGSVVSWAIGLAILVLTVVSALAIGGCVAATMIHRRTARMSANTALQATEGAPMSEAGIRIGP